MRRRRLAGSVVTAAIIALSACGDDDVVPGDGGRDAGAVDAMAPDAGSLPMPDPPLLPVLGPCPDGWREIPEDLATGAPALCEPWPETGLEACADDAMHLPGTPGCVRVGTECPADGFPSDLPTDVPVLFVRAGVVSGDGSRASPFATIQEAETVAPDGAVIAISVGRHPAPFILDHPVTLRGACSATEIGGNPALGYNYVTRAAGTRVSNLSFVEGDNGFAMLVGSLDLSDVVFRDIRTVALSLDAGPATVRNVAIVRTGMVALELGETNATISRISVRDGFAMAVYSLYGNLTLTDSVVTNIGRGGTPSLVLANGEDMPSVLRFERTVFDQNGSSGIYVYDMAAIELVDVLVRLPSKTPTVRDAGMLALGGARMTMERVRVEGSLFQGLGVGDGSTASLRDVILRDIVPDPTSGNGTALEVVNGSTAEVERVLVERALGLGVLVDGSSATLTDVTFRDIEPSRSDGRFGRAIQAQVASTVTATRVSVLRAHEAAIVAASRDTRIDATHLTVVDTRPSDCTTPGCEAAGVAVASLLDARIAVDRFLVRESALVGGMLALRGELDLENGIVERNPIGVNVQVDGYDLARLTRNVAYRENGTNLDSSALPVPSASVGM